MLIVCPSCASEYTVDAALLSGGRQVKCASCGTSWLAKPETASPPPPTVIEGRAVPRAKPKPAGRPSKRRAGRSGASIPGARWAAVSLVVIAVGSTGAILLRNTVVSAAPRSAALFGAIGLPVNLPGIALRDVSSVLADEGGKPVLVTEGVLSSAASGTVGVPRIEITVESPEGDVLYRWSVKPPIAELAPGEAAGFRARLTSPPPAGRRVLVTLMSPRDEADVASR